MAWLIEGIILFIYNLAIRFYFLLIKTASIRNKKAKHWVEGRKNIFDKISASLKPGEDRIWFHCASLGEFEQGRPLIELLKKNHPGYKIVLTFFSPSGYEIRKYYPFADYIFYLPVDTSANAKKFVTLVNPAFAVFIKYEFWYYYFKRLEKNKIPLFVISTVFRNKQLFFKWYGGIFRKMLNAVTHFFVQDEKSEHLLRNIEFGNATIIPDTRIDRVAEISKNAKQIPAIENFLQGNKAVIGGSIYLAEASFLKMAIEDKLITKKLIIAPHNTDQETITKLLNIFGNDAVLFSDKQKDFSKFRVLIVDSIGLLSSIYNYGIIAVIGGGFGQSIHNILEPASFGLPIIFGPNYHKFKEAHELINSGGAFTFKHKKEFIEILKKLNSPESLLNAGNTSKNYILQRIGGTEKIYNWILERKLLAKK